MRDIASNHRSTVYPPAPPVRGTATPYR